MKKVYITSLHMMHGGVEMAITLLANALVKRGYDVEILCIYNLGEPVYKLEKQVSISYLTKMHPNREEFSLAMHSGNIIAIVREGMYALKVLYLKNKQLIDKIKKIDEGIIISTRNEHSVLLSKYANKNVKKIAQLHHDHNFNTKLLKDFNKRYNNIDVFVLLTDLLKNEIQEVMKNNLHTRCITIPNFLEDFALAFNEEREGQVVAVGRLHEVKGFQRLIEIWKNINERVVLKIIGDGNERPKLEALINKYNLENKVILTGALDHNSVMKEMQKSLFYVMTSFTEAFPFVLIEAMANGLPIVAYDVRVGPMAIIENNKNGFLVPDENHSEFEKDVKLLIEDSALRKQMSNSALQRSKNFMESNVINMWIDILEE